MPRRTDEEIFRDSVPTDGTSIGNRRLCDNLGWDESKYERVKERLLDQGLIYMGKGNGGSVRLVKGDKRALRRSVPKDGSAISDSRVREQLGWGEDVYKKVRGWLIDDGVLRAAHIGKESVIALVQPPSASEKEAAEEDELHRVLLSDKSGYSIPGICTQLQWSEDRFHEVRARLIQKGRLKSPSSTGSTPLPVPVTREKSAFPGGAAPTQDPLSKTGPIEIFISYSHHDRAEMEILDQHLSALKRQGLVATWHDGQIAPGSDWSDAIRKNLERAHIIVLLISRSFMASEYCYSTELRRAIERHAAGTAKVIPVILKPCDWDGAPFSHLQALPRGATPVTSSPHPDEAYTAVAKGIRSVVQERAAAPTGRQE